VDGTASSPAQVPTRLLPGHPTMRPERLAHRQAFQGVEACASSTVSITRVVVDGTTEKGAASVPWG
jgi:hypothetical protein